ncbi:MAG: hypothetical protein JWQ96_123 [Segetibacter sp.]|nr:hypothetical protein [Segetibacter sp.]
MLTTIKPGQIVKHYSKALHYGLQMEVIDIKDVRAMVAFINLDGKYEELWINRDELDLFEEKDLPKLYSTS